MKNTKSVLSRRLAFLAPAVLAAAPVLHAGEYVSAPLGPTLAPEPSGLEAEFHVGYTSDYIFRGARLGGDLWEFGLDFAGSGLWGLDWSAGIWYASYEFDVMDYNSSNNELDIYGEVGKTFGDVFSVAVGITNYSYFGNGIDGGVNDDIEPYVSIGAEFFGISFGAGAYYDGADNYAYDLYYEFTAGWETEFTEELSGGLELVLGVFDEDTEIYYGGTASLSYAVSEHITVSPHASLTLSDDFGDYFFGGVSIGFGF